MAKLTSQQRGNLSDSDFAYIDSKGGRHLPIHDETHVRNALARFNQTHFESSSAKATARRKIRAAARKFGIKVTNSTLIEGDELGQIVCLEFDPTKAVLPPEDPRSGVMRVRVPFYQGDSIARPSGWSEPLFFAADELPGIIASGREQIQRGQQPLSVYARHMHAVTADHLPIGRVVSLEQEGHIGYATLEIADDGDFGTRVQHLITAKMLNAVSLRSTSELTLEERKVNGELMAMPVGMKLAGIDFAPEGPAMPTFGMQVLAEAPTVEPHETTPHQEDNDNMDITLEAVRAVPAVVAELEKPLRDRIVSLESAAAASAKTLETRDAELKAANDRVAALELEKGKAEAQGAIAEVASRFPKPKKARKVLAEICKDATSKADVVAAAMPLLLEAVESLNKSKAEGKGKGKDGDADQKPNPAVVLAELLGATVAGGSGRSDVPDKTRTVNDKVEYAGNMPLPPE